MTRLKVAVRVRPLSDREIQAKSPSVVRIESNNVAITNIKVPEQNAGDSRERVRRFNYDYCFDENSTQDEVYNIIGSVIQHAIQNRFHSCVLAYGQSASGKTHTMMGSAEDPGITPRLCQDIFTYSQHTSDALPVDCAKTYVSYLEIYNEKVRDLLGSSESSELDEFKTLKVREHPKKGPYVQGLSEHPVCESSDLLKLLQNGNNRRKIAATVNNPQSSRSHSVFTITSCEGIKLHLIDLAGSEKANTRGRGTARFREGANINKSLVALGNVISVLAEKSCRNRRNRHRFVPYRDSLLTWLLKDTLGGNSKTIMIATVSPSNLCYSETINTLRFGQRAKQVISQPVVNQGSSEKLIKELRDEILRLRHLLFQNKVFSTNVKTSTEHYRRFASVPSMQMFSHPTHIRDNTAKSVNSSAFSLHSSTDKLFRVMDVTSTVKDEKANLRRTFSASDTAAAPKTQRTFGSQGSLLSKVTRETQTRLSNEKLLKNESARKLWGRASHGTTEIAKRKLLPVKTFGHDPPKRSSIKPRSAIVAAVTERLYSTAKKKEEATENKTGNQENQGNPRAQIKLRELTERLLKAHRRRNQEVQTEPERFIRFKEKSTDIIGLKEFNNEVQHVGVNATPAISDAGVNCCFIDDASKRAFITTRTCGTQSCDYTSKNESPSKASLIQNRPLSFTKYLHSRPTTNLCQANPIFTTSLNINVTHDRVSAQVIEDSSSDDSLENNQSNMYFTTPDLISNHNSLDANCHQPATSDQCVVSLDNIVKYAETVFSAFVVDVADDLLCDFPCSYCFARCSVYPPSKLSVPSIVITTVHAPELFILTELDRCTPLNNTQIAPQKAQLINEASTDLNYLTTSVEPVILKSIMKHNLPIEKEDQGNKRIFEASNIPDSLNYHHLSNSKKVHFDNKELFPNRMFMAMSNFLEEAADLMSNLTLITKKLENDTNFVKDYSVEVTVDNISSLEDAITIKENQTNKNETGTQTSTAETVKNFEIPVNRFETLVEDACNRLEKCITKAECSGYNTSRNDYKFMHPFGISQDVRNATDDSSQESYPTYSDYGSLPRKPKPKYLNTAPSAFLRHLTHMRENIIKNSREELQNQAD